MSTSTFVTVYTNDLYAQRVEVKSLTVIAICPRTKKNFDPTGNVFIPCVLLLTQISCFIIDDYDG